MLGVTAEVKLATAVAATRKAASFGTQSPHDEAQTRAVPVGAIAEPVIDEVRRAVGLPRR